ncbi:hypothetical protein QBC46DRAFT_402824 [Diplogelasinospora grovesii]|uniref:FAD-binding domain-containing protein n=1 Tax=Diplogelasinospora grovesii TaxID=303347 RepID=A0AAN6NIJ2_9PEZI|nr:hypothetical protein QBC46DRAFT_402824 [Diplogelasinospora grovesii]
MSSPKIAIIGAGPAGCMLARLLSLSPISISVTVFEGESSPNYRSQGGSLDLHTSTGLAAIKAAGLWDQFLASARYDGDFMQTTDKNLKAFLKVDGTTTTKNRPRSGPGGLSDQRPEIDRSELRRILTESLPAGMIRWGYHLEQVDGDGTLVFKDGTTETGFDLVVGADGAWSKVRALLSDQRPIFSGVGMIEMGIPDAQQTAPEVYRVVNRGNVFAYAEGRKLAVQQMGDGSINVYAGFRADDENWAKTCGYDPTNLAETQKALLREGGLYGDWHPTLKEAMQRATVKCIPRSLYQLPVGFRWEHREGVTVMGDAAHLMTPFAGEGVNLALQDAVSLAKLIIDAVQKGKGGKAKEEKGDGDVKEGLDEAVREYEEEMWPRAGKVARLTDDLTKAWMFTPNTPQSVIAATTAMHVKFHTPGIVHPLTTAGVYSYFFFKGLVN